MSDESRPSATSGGGGGGGDAAAGRDAGGMSLPLGGGGGGGAMPGRPPAGAGRSGGAGPAPAPPARTPHGFGPDHTPYDAIGGDARVRELTDRFYDRMDAEPAYRVIRDLHPADLDEARQKLYEFLSGWMGGPQLYMQRRGHPRLRMRHAPFPIGEAERDQWLACMRDAMDAMGIDGDLRAFLEQRFAHVADFMRNRPG